MLTTLCIVMCFLALYVVYLHKQMSTIRLDLEDTDGMARWHGIAIASGGKGTDRAIAILKEKQVYILYTTEVLQDRVRSLENQRRTNAL